MKFLIFWGLYIPLLLIRFGFSVSESYIHPDEYLQGIQVVAGDILKIKVEYPWEFKGPFPIRSIGPLWMIYGLPVKLAQWITGKGCSMEPLLLFFLLRIFFFGLSFIVDWFVYTSTSPKYRGNALLLYASSFVTYTYQTHTFSNSIETIMVSACLLLMRKNKMSMSSWKCVLLAIFASIGFFSRITFPIILIPFGFLFIKSLVKRPKMTFLTIKSFIIVFFILILVDSLYYANGRRIVLTILNNFNYNINYANLQKHGIHAYWTHFLINIPVMLGPAIFLPVIIKKIKFDIYLISSIIYITVLSLFPHQEFRFLLPVFPLLIVYLCSLGSIKGRKKKRLFMFSWIIYNILVGLFFVNQLSTNIIFWKTYPPPTWLFLRHSDSNIVFTHLIGYSVDHVLEYLSAAKKNKIIFIFPISSMAKFSCVFDELKDSFCKTNITLRQIFKTSYHINLDDLDFMNNNIFSLLLHLVRKRGLGIWDVI
ncbi:unnamed protein product [Pneumocystis jirovecii]|uniref:Mannosyltransferase n=1 Tax=Pneumocystis jirovecii TaxID=42068 RepID=L0PIQ9_PNEJI|nr:unnamed protein product [Pneumocystis jirovecii]